MISLQEKFTQLRERFKRDGWLFALLAAGILACLLLGAAESTPHPAEGNDAYIASILSSMEGAGQVEVVVSYQGEDDTVPCGAVVIAQGADDVLVQLRLRRALSALTGLPDSKIEIFKREEVP